MRGRLILLTVVAAASATAVVAAVISAMPRTPASLESSVVAQAATQMPGVALDEKDATVQRFLGYENAASPTPEPEPTPEAPLAPRYRGGDRGSSNAGQGGTAENGSTDAGVVTETPAPPAPDPTPSSPSPSPTPSPTPTDDGATPGETPTTAPEEPRLTTPDAPSSAPTEELLPAD